MVHIDNIFPENNFTREIILFFDFIAYLILIENFNKNYDIIN